MQVLLGKSVSKNETIGSHWGSTHQQCPPGSVTDAKQLIVPGQIHKVTKGSMHIHATAAMQKGEDQCSTRLFKYKSTYIIIIGRLPVSLPSKVNGG